MFLQAPSIELSSGVIDISGGGGGYAGHGGSGGYGGDGSSSYYDPQTGYVGFGGQGGNGGRGGNGGNGGDGGPGGFLNLRAGSVNISPTNLSIAYGGGGGGIGGGWGLGGQGRDSGLGSFSPPPGLQGDNGVSGTDGRNGLDGGVITSIVAQSPGIANGGFSSGLAFFRQSGGGSASIVSVAGDPALDLSTDTASGPISLLQMISTPSTSPIELRFDYHFVTPTGSLDVLLDGTLLAHVTATGASSPFGTPSLHPSGSYSHLSLMLSATALLGQPGAQFELRLNPGSPAEVQLDNLNLTIPNVGVERGSGAAPMLALRADPNPVLTGTRFWFALPAAGLVELKLFDLTGRCIRTLGARASGVGPGSVDWDGREDSGTPARPGIYWVNLEAGTQRISARISVLR